MAAVEAALTVGKRVGGSFHVAPRYSYVRLVQSPDHLQIIVQHFVEIPAFRAGLCQNHGQMEAHRTDIEPSHKYRDHLHHLPGAFLLVSYQGLKNARHPIGLITFP